MKKVTSIFAKFAKQNKVDVIISPDARGFLFGIPTSIKANIPFVMARKPGKLPGEKISEK